MLPPEKVAHSAYLSAELDMHPNRHFPAHFVVHMPSCLHVLFHLVRSKLGGVRGLPLGVCPLMCAKIPLRAGDYYTTSFMSAQQSSIFKNRAPV